MCTRLRINLAAGKLHTSVQPLVTVLQALTRTVTVVPAGSKPWLDGRDESAILVGVWFGQLVAMCCAECWWQRRSDCSKPRCSDRTGDPNDNRLRVMR